MENAWPVPSDPWFANRVLGPIALWHPDKFADMGSSGDKALGDMRVMAMKQYNTGYMYVVQLLHLCCAWLSFSPPQSMACRFTPRQPKDEKDITQLLRAVVGWVAIGLHALQNDYRRAEEAYR